MAFILTGALTDIFTHVAQSYPTAIEPVAAYISTPVRTLIQFTTLLSYILAVASLITAPAAVLSGGVQAIGLMQERGFKARTVKMTVLHAVLMDITIAGVAYNWYTRREAKGYESQVPNVAISAISILLLLYSGKLGGSLVYDHGIGVSKIGQAKKGANKSVKKDE